MQASNVMVILYVHNMGRAGWSMSSCGDAIVALHLIGPDMIEGSLPHAGLLQVDHLETAINHVCKAGGRVRWELEKLNRRESQRE